jgi:hypothetical protein
VRKERGRGDKLGESGRSDLKQNITPHGRSSGFDSKGNVKPMEDCMPEREKIWLLF